MMLTHWRYIHQNKRQGKREKRFSSAFFQLKGTELVLNLPQQRLSVGQIENEIILNFYNEDKLLSELSKQLRVFGQVMFRTEEERIKLNRLYKYLRYEIVSGGDEVVYDSKEKLYRDNIIFNSDGSEEISGKDLGVGDIKVVTGIDVEIVPDCNFEKITKEQYVIYVLFLREDSSFLLDNRFYSLEHQKYESQTNYEYKYRGAYLHYKGRTYDIYTALPSFGIRCNGAGNPKNYIVNINDTQLHLSSFGKTKSVIVEDGSGDEYLSCALNERQIQSNKLHSLTVRKAGDSKLIIKEDFIVIPDFKCLFGKEFYFNEKAVIITDIIGNELHFNEIKFPHTVICGAENAATLLCGIGNTECELIVELPVVSWKMGTYSEGSDESVIWHKSIDEFIFTLKCSFVAPNLIIDNKIAVHGDKRYAAYYYDLKSFFDLEKDFEIGAEIKGKYIQLINIAFTPKIVETNFAYKKNMQTVLGYWKFIGDGNLKIEIFSREGYEKVFSKLFANSNTFEEPLPLPYGFYNVKISQEQKDEFGTSGSDELLLHESTFIAGDKFYILLKGAEVKVDNCYYFDRKFEVENFYFDSLKIEQENSLYVASAFFYKRKMKTGELFKWYMNDINPVRIEIINVDKHLYTIEIREQSDDGLIYDIETKHIMPDGGQRDRKRYQTADYYGLDLEGLM